MRRAFRGEMFGFGGKEGPTEGRGSYNLGKGHTVWRKQLSVSRDVCGGAVLTMLRDDDGSLSKQEVQMEEEEGEDRGTTPPTAHPQTLRRAHLLMSHQR